MIPPTVPPFPFYIINKDIIKGSFPFRKTFLTPKLDFAARFHNPDFDRPACSADPKSRNRIPETEQTEGEGRSACRSPISQPRFRPPRVFRRHEEPEQNHGNGTNRRRRTLCQLKPISQPRFQPPRVFRRPEEPEQNHGNGTNRRRRTLCQLKPISQPRFRTLDSDRPACSADPKSRNRIPETEQTEGEGKFFSPENTPIQRLFYLCPEDFKTRFQTSPSGSSESPLLSPLRHRYCQVNPPTERLNNTHGNICNQVTSVDEFRCFSAFCA